MVWFPSGTCPDQSVASSRVHSQEARGMMQGLFCYSCTDTQRSCRKTVSLISLITASVPTGSPSHGGDVAVYVFDINQPSLPTPFYFVLVSASVFMALSTVFHSINSSDNSLLSDSVLPVLFLPCWPFHRQYLFMKVSFSPDVILSGWLGLKHQLTN